MNILFENLEKLIDAPSGIEKTRELILQLAIQGKLSVQSKNETVLTDDKNKPISKDKYPFNIPSNWEFLKLSDVSEFNVGKTPPTKESKYWDKMIGHYWVSISDMVNKGVVNNTKKRITDIAVDKIFRKSPSPIGTLIMSFKLTIGKVSILAVPAYHNEAIISIYPNELIEKEYLYKILPSIVVYGENKNAIKGKTLNGDSLNKLAIPIPPIAEQKRIVEKVNSLMALLNELEEKRERRNQKRIKLNNASLEKLLTSKDDEELKTNWKRIEENFITLYSVPENVDKLKQAILQLAVQGKLVKQDPNDEPATELLKKIKIEKDKLIADGKIKKQKELPPIKEEEKPFELPKGWEWVRLAEITKVIAGYGFDSRDFNSKDGTKCVKITNAGVHKIVESQDFLPFSYKAKYKDFLLNTGDIIVALTRPYIVDGLKVCKIPELYNEALLNQRVAAVKKVFKLNFDYLFQFLCSDFVLSKYKSRFQKSGLQPNLKMEDLTMLEIPLPPHDEQKRIVEKANELLSLCNTLEEKLTKKEETAERLVGAVVNAVANKTIKQKDDKVLKKEKIKERIDELIKKHHIGLEKLS